jgi:hypothetical protein
MTMRVTPIKHFDEAYESALDALRVLVQEEIIQRAVLIPDLYARIRVIVWPLDKVQVTDEVHKQVAERLAAAAGLFWSGDVWLAPGETRADREMFEGTWEESTSVTPEIHLDERYRSMGVWLRLPLEPPWQTDDSAEEYGSPIVTFYSFRGGVGRTTALAAFALQRANRGERVAVVDLDLEAPGLDALLSTEEGISARWGVVDYLLEQPLLNNVDLRDYYHLANPRLTGAGQVFVIPAGHFDMHYLPKLARVDFSPPPESAPGGCTEPHPLECLLRHLRDEFRPHWVLLDSRTGLSEVAGFVLGGFAHLNVLFGTTAESSWQGLHYAVQRLGAERVQRGILQAECLLVQAMVSDNPEVARVAENAFDLRAEDEFREFYYAEDPEDAQAPEEDRFWYIRDMESRDAPHVPIPLYYTQRLAFFTSTERVKDILLTSPDYLRLGERIASRFTGSQER